MCIHCVLSHCAVFCAFTQHTHQLMCTVYSDEDGIDNIECVAGCVVTQCEWGVGGVAVCVYIVCTFCVGVE